MPGDKNRNSAKRKRVDALDVPCSGCGAVAGERCRGCGLFLHHGERELIRMRTEQGYVSPEIPGVASAGWYDTAEEYEEARAAFGQKGATDGAK